MSNENIGWFKGQVLREMVDAKEEHQSASMGSFYQGEFMHYPATTDLSEVVEVVSGVCNNAGQYNGNPKTTLYMRNGSFTTYLVSYDKFMEQFSKYQEWAAKQGQTMIKQLAGE